MKYDLETLTKHLSDHYGLIDDIKSYICDSSKNSKDEISITYIKISDCKDCLDVDYDYWGGGYRYNASCTIPFEKIERK